MPHRLPALLVAAFVFLTGCAGTSRVPSSAASAGRPIDALLERADLQAIVDLQVLRDGRALAEHLSDADPTVRARAAFALGSVQDAETVSALIAALEDESPAVRADAAWAIGQSADSTVAGYLFRALRAEGTPSVQRELFLALARTGTEADAQELLRLEFPPTLDASRLRALAFFAMRDRLANDGYAAAAAFLHDQRPEVREEAAYVFARSEGGAAVAPALREAFDAGTGDLARVHLARAIAALNSDDDTDRLADALANDPDWRTRVAAATGLADRLRQPTARGALVRALDDGVHHVRVAAASALASDGPLPREYLDRLETWVAARDTADWHAGAALLPALVRGGRLGPAQAWLDRHVAPFARASGLAAFAFATDDASLERLTTLATDADSRIRNAALTALASRWRRGRSNALAARLFVPLRAAVESGDPAAVTLAAPVFADSLFVMYEAPSVLRAAYRQLEAPADLEAMVALLNAIGQVRDAGEIDFLLDIAIAGQEPALRRAAVDALNDRLVDGIDVDLSEVETARATAGIDWAFLARLGRAPRLELTTSRGVIVVEMDPERAPQTVQSLTRTVREGLYDGVPFHRVVPGFVAQGGDYVRRDGWGGPDTPIRSEFSRLSYRTGTAGMASSGKDTEGSQFFFMHAPHPHLDGRYTIWGQVVDGQAVVDALRVGDVIQSARVRPSADASES